MYVNQLDTTQQCATSGYTAEQLFAVSAQNKNWTCAPANPAQNIFQHIDFIITKNNKQVRVDVKAMKKLSRSDDTNNVDWVWIELHGVGESNEGWLYGGASDVIAFQYPKHFVLVKRKSLIELVEKLVNKEKQVYESQHAKYCIYKRQGRHDVLTLISTKDLLTFKHWIWEY